MSFSLTSKFLANARGLVFEDTASATWGFNKNTNQITLTTGGGTVGSVGLADGSSAAIYTVTGSPVTGSGTLTFTLKTQSANTVLAGPGSGAAAQPTFRALVAADLTGLLPTAASPTGKVGLTAVNGSSAHFMRADGAPPIDQAITPTWTGTHTFSTAPVINGMSWAAPTLLNSWVNFGSPYNNAGYYKDPTGRVFLRGLVKSGSSSSAIICTLPVGYRPANTCVLAGVANNALCELYVDSSGNVYANSGGSTTWTSLDSVSFATF